MSHHKNMITPAKTNGLWHFNRNNKKMNSTAAASTTYLHCQQRHQGRQAFPYMRQHLLFISITANSDMKTTSKHEPTGVPVGDGGSVWGVLHSQGPELLMAELQHTIQGEGLPQALVQLCEGAWWCSLLGAETKVIFSMLKGAISSYTCIKTYLKRKWLKPTGRSKTFTRKDLVPTWRSMVAEHTHSGNMVAMVSSAMTRAATLSACW